MVSDLSLSVVPKVTVPLVFDEDEMGRDFVSSSAPLSSLFCRLNAILVQMGFLENLVKVFPSLATRPLYLTGESYAGTYIVSVSCYIRARSAS